MISWVSKNDNKKDKLSLITLNHLPRVCRSGWMSLFGWSLTMSLCCLGWLQVAAGEGFSKWLMNVVVPWLAKPSHCTEEQGRSVCVHVSAPVFCLQAEAFYLIQASNAGHQRHWRQRLQRRDGVCDDSARRWENDAVGCRHVIHCSSLITIWFKFDEWQLLFVQCCRQH